MGEMDGKKYKHLLYCVANKEEEATMINKESQG